MALMIFLVLLTKITIGICVTPKPIPLNYGNYSLYTTVPTEAHQLKFLQNLETEKYLDVIYWKRPVKLYYDVHMLIHNTETEMFLERAKHYNLAVKMNLYDVQEAFKNQTIRQYVRLRENSFNFDNYHSIEDIYQWLTDMSTKHKNCVLLSIGKSVEGRDIFVMSFKNGVKKNVIIEAGIHGNEWIAIEFALYLIDKLIQEKAFTQAKKFNWYIIPILNPDGFAYSHTTDRLWRKNRRPIGKEFGVDLNRNFNYNFRAYSSSIDPRDDEYCGPEPFSEPETLALKNFLRTLKTIKYYFSFHAYGQAIIIPYGDRVKHMGDYSEMENYGKQAIIKMFAANRSKYTIGTIYDTMGVKISGNSASWVKRVYRAKYVMTFMMRDNGTYGHALPADQIEATCNETLAGLQTVMTAQARYVPTNLFGSSTSLNNNLLTFFCTLAAIAIFVVKL
ncbi:zinc carboxypeptidase-like [Plodia interpunctella]|uniref:zinc carboxypeptidase-like n=1 Tax=Plodia interpunctella TaxID=58824 RepID=UPI002367E6DD|nr:zinc carboxypeptidase-like [Plodia interpunctella]